MSKSTKARPSKPFVVQASACPAGLQRFDSLQLERELLRRAIERGEANIANLKTTLAAMKTKQQHRIAEARKVSAKLMSGLATKN